MGTKSSRHPQNSSSSTTPNSSSTNTNTTADSLDSSSPPLETPHGHYHRSTVHQFSQPQQSPHIYHYSTPSPLRQSSHVYHHPTPSPLPQSSRAYHYFTPSQPPQMPKVVQPPRSLVTSQYRPMSQAPVSSYHPISRPSTHATYRRH